MPQNQRNIPLNTMEDGFALGIAMERNEFKRADFLAAFEMQQQAVQSHRDEGYTFHILESGRVEIEIDFKFFQVCAPAVVYLHPDQVHRMRDADDIVVCSLSVNAELLHPSYLELLETLAPTSPLHMDPEVFNEIKEAFSTCLKFYQDKSRGLSAMLLKDSGNLLVGLLLSAFSNQKKQPDTFSRYERVAKAFRKLLDEHYCRLKRPGEYAGLLNISTPYLNECIKNATGFSASQLIQDRVILEAKRLLYHTDKSIKEIAFVLGYTDYAYFSRLFSSVTGLSAKAFRLKNLD